MSVYILARKDKLLYHFGILMNDNIVIHFASKTNNMFAGDQLVRFDKVEDFAIQREIIKVYEISGQLIGEITDRAKQYWGNNKKYTLNNNNCILFVLWCLKIQERRNLVTVIRYYLHYCAMIHKVKYLKDNL